jgi:hypothetical protein
MSTCIVPLVPDGTTLDSFVATIHQANINKNFKITSKLVLGVERPARDLFGVCAHDCANFVPSGPLSNETTILEKHSLWPLYAYTLSPPLREAWKLGILEKRKHISKSFTSGLRQDQIVKNDIFQCLDCVSSDIDSFLWPQWRTYHQLHGVHHCIMHKSPLISNCQKCGCKLKKAGFALPTLKCPLCGAKLSSIDLQKYPAPYWTMLRILRFLFDGNWSLLSPNFRRAYYEGSLQNKGAWPPNLKSTRVICADIRKRWKITSFRSLSRLLNISFDITTETIRLAISGRDANCMPMLHCILLEHFSSTSNNIPDLFCWQKIERESANIQLPLVSGPYALPRDKQIEALSALDSAGVSRELMFKLAANDFRAGWRRQTYFTNYRANIVYTTLPWFAAYWHAVRWCGKQRNTPDKIKPTLRRYKELALKYTAPDGPGWLSFQHEHMKAYRYLRKHDRSFFDLVRRIKRAHRLPWRFINGEAHKQAILAAVSDPCRPNRTMIRLKVEWSIRWAIQNCPAWLEHVLPPRGMSRNRVAQPDNEDQSRAASRRRRAQ